MTGVAEQGYYWCLGSGDITDVGERGITGVGTGI